MDNINRARERYRRRGRVPRPAGSARTGPALAISIVFGLVSVAAASDSQRMLVAADGAVCYVDFENADRTPASSWITVYDTTYTGSLPAPRSDSVQTAFVSGGVVRTRDRAPAAIGQDEFYAVFRFNEWLAEHVPEGSVLKLLPAQPFRPEAQTHGINFIDRPLAASNQMVVYTPAMGRVTPATIFRRELIVSAGRIVARAGGNCRISANGFVVSGHLMSALWLSRWGLIGSRVSYSADQVTITIDREAWFRNAQYYLSYLARRVALRVTHDGADRRALAGLRSDLARARQIADADAAQSWRLVQDVLSRSKGLLLRGTRSPQSELRGVWMPSVLEGAYLDEFATRMAGAGVNAVGPQVLDWTPAGVARLNAMATKLREHGMKTFAWTWLPSAPLGPFADVLQEHPDWEDHSRSAGLKQPDLAHADALAWCCEAVTQACREANIDGILFDYEGYRGGYSPRSRAAFVAHEGLPDSFDPRTLSAKDGPRFRAWRRWRRQIIINAARAMVAAARAANPKLQLAFSCAAPDYSAGLYDNETLHMVWPDWLEQPTFDLVSTMAYAQDARWVAGSCRKAAGIIAGRARFAPSLILYPETGGSVPIETELLIEQVEAARASGAAGIWLFMGVQFMPFQGPRGEDLYQCLRNGLFRTSAR